MTCRAAASDESLAATGCGKRTHPRRNARGRRRGGRPGKAAADQSSVIPSPIRHKSAPTARNPRRRAPGARSPHGRRKARRRRSTRCLSGQLAGGTGTTGYRALCARRLRSATAVPTASPTGYRLRRLPATTAPSPSNPNEAGEGTVKELNCSSHTGSLVKL